MSTTEQTTRTVPRLLAGRVLMAAPDIDDAGEYEGDSRWAVADVDEAHVATSELDGTAGPYGSRHAPLLDLDIPHTVEVGSTWERELYGEEVTRITLDLTEHYADRRPGDFGRDFEIARHLLQNIDAVGHIVDVYHFGGGPTTMQVAWTIPTEAVEIVPSSTEGHAHVYIDASLAGVVYERLLVALARIGVLEPGFVRASISRGHSAARLPWVRKGSLTLSSEVRPKPEPLTLAVLDEYVENVARQAEPAPFVDRPVRPAVS